MRANIRQVAERAQVSRMTVSRVLQNRRNEVTDETYERVVAALQELNYVPVRTAVQNHHTKTNVIGVVPHSSNILGYALDLQTLGGLCSKSAQCGYDVLVMQRGESEWMANRRELRFLDRRTDGFIFISPGESEWREVIAQLVEHGLPVVVCYRRDVPEGVAWVDPDNEEVIRLAIDALVEKGHKKVAYIGSPVNPSGDPQLLADLSGARANFDDKQRRGFFNERVEQLGLERYDALDFHVDGATSDMNRTSLRSMLDAAVTGVVCFNGSRGQLVFDELKKMELKTPDDLSIVSFDWSDKSARQGLTHVTFTYESVGQLAIEAWLGLNAGEPAEECSRVVPVKLVECGSVGNPKAQG